VALFGKWYSQGCNADRILKGKHSLPWVMCFYGDLQKKLKINLMLYNCREISEVDCIRNPCDGALLYHECPEYKRNAVRNTK